MTITITTPRVVVSGSAYPSRSYVPVGTSTVVLAASERLAVRRPDGQRATLLELREDTSRTFRAAIHDDENLIGSTARL